LLKKLFAYTGVLLAGGVMFLGIRGDVRAAVSAWARKGETGSAAVAYLKETPTAKLQIGAGTNNKEGWFNTDIEVAEGQWYLDASRPFPLPDSSFQYVYSEHVIEHLAYEQGLVMLRESYRVLKPGGKVRIATPNLAKIAELLNPELAARDSAKSYIADKSQWHELPKTPDPAAFILNVEMRTWGHQFVYSPALLRGVLEQVGFRDVKEFTAGESDDPVLKGAEARDKWNERDINRFETMVLQATR
jgi:predicted SAM-dependent methyltransferase